MKHRLRFNQTLSHMLLVIFAVKQGATATNLFSYSKTLGRYLLNQPVKHSGNKQTHFTTVSSCQFQSSKPDPASTIQLPMHCVTSAYCAVLNASPVQQQRSNTEPLKPKQIELTKLPPTVNKFKLKTKEESQFSLPASCTPPGPT